MQAKHFRKVIPKGQLNEDSNTLTTAVTPANNKKGTDEEGEESGNDSDEAPSHADGAHDSDPEVVINCNMYGHTLISCTELQKYLMIRT